MSTKKTTCEFAVHFNQKKHLLSHFECLENKESTSSVHACASRVHPALFAFAFAAYAYGCAFTRSHFLLHTAKRLNWRTIIFLALKTDQI